MFQFLAPRRCLLSGVAFSAVDDQPKSGLKCNDCWNILQRDSLQIARISIVTNFYFVMQPA